MCIGVVMCSFIFSRGANVGLEDSNRTTPLHTASFHGHPRIVALLLEKNADVNATVRERERERERERVN